MKNNKVITREGGAARAVVRRAAWLAGLAILVVVLLFYTVGQPFSIPVAGQAAGVGGLIFIVISLLLMLRLPSLARFAGGLEAMYAMHRGFGLAGYGLLLLHPLLLAQKGGWAELTMSGKSLDFRTGWTAILTLMVVLFCTFILKTRGYAIWRRLHMLSMVAFLFMAWHVIAYQSDWSLAGKIFLDGVLLVGLMVPLVRYFYVDQGVWAAPYVVDQVRFPAHGVIDVQLAPRANLLAVQAGQFVFARFLAGEKYLGCGHFHPFTASAIADDGRLRLSIKSNGACTSQMQNLEPGAGVLLQGPFGNLFQNVRQDTQVWIAGGIGITPFLARLRMLDATHVPVRLFYFFDHGKEVVFLDEIEALVRSKPMVSFHPVATQKASESITVIFDALLPPWDDKHYVLCGSAGFTDFVRAYLARHGVGSATISQERFEFR